MTTRVSATARNLALNALVSQLDAGSGSGYIQVRTGTQPASITVAATGTLLGTLTLSDPAFGSASAGSITANAVAGTNAGATGTAGWFRAYNSSGQAVVDGNITSTAGGGDMTMGDTLILIGAPIEVGTWTITMPET